MKHFLRLAFVLALFANPAAMAGEQQHCVTESENLVIVTQCDDGTVTVVNVRDNRVAVCRKGESCKKIQL
uniref:hypothetical protein n=1 Tax=Escherichia marmotae TaxID=1499973 RepID=UPI001E2E3FBF|nr:hypothetical protein [Escherichia marmotae]